MGMARFYMNLRYRDRLFVDEEGDELADEHAVLGHALDTARDLIAYARTNTIRNWGGCSEGASRACRAQLKRFLRTGAGSPAKAVLASTLETSTTRRRPRSVSTLTCMLVPAGTQAGWHQSKKLVVPDNITLMPLPAKAPELNPVENIWQYMRENWI